MRTAVNGRLLFLNATWYGDQTAYGFDFATPVEIARFVDTFCLRDHLWHFEVVDGSLEYYALAPFSTYFAEFAAYSEDARSAAKWGGGHPDFWLKYLISTIYFSELHKRVQYVATYPGHSAGSGSGVMEQPMLTFTKCFRVSFLRDLVVRHTASIKSARARAAGGTVDQLNQLNTIVLRRDPLKPSGNDRYKRSPLAPGKTVLVVDDICTMGYSLEAARAYVQQTGAKVIGLSWLKTINRGYSELLDLPRFDPFVQNSFSAVRSREHSYRTAISDAGAAAELHAKLRAYDDWKWPSGG